VSALGGISPAAEALLITRAAAKQAHTSAKRALRLSGGTDEQARHQLASAGRQLVQCARTVGFKKINRTKAQRAAKKAKEEALASQERLAVHTQKARAAAAAEARVAPTSPPATREVQASAQGDCQAVPSEQPQHRAPRGRGGLGARGDRAFEGATRTD
jgi:hypothetical protein